MKAEIMNQYSHFWRTYRKVCSDFDLKSWKESGFGITQPGRLALHILQSTIFYVEGKEPLVLKDGSPVECHSAEMDREALPDLENILFCLETVEKKTEDWINNMEFESRNEKFPWTGETAFSVALFVLRHSQYHLGEMNAMLNEQFRGKADDYFANQL